MVSYHHQERREQESEKIVNESQKYIYIHNTGYKNGHIIQSITLVFFDLKKAFEWILYFIVG